MNVKFARVVSKADGDKLKLASEVERIPSVKIAFFKRFYLWMWMFWLMMGVLRPSLLFIFFLVFFLFGRRSLCSLSAFYGPSSTSAEAGTSYIYPLYSLFR